MLRIHANGTRLCDGLSRRALLQVGGVGLLGMGSLLQAKAAAGSQSGKARGCIQLFFLGGPPQHETWDPKPDAPAEIRGDLKPIATATPGLVIGELMPRTARLTAHLAVLRAVQTGDNAHSSSGYYMTTGYPHQPMGVENAKLGAPNHWPSFGAVVRRVGRNSGRLPTAITLPEQSANDGNLTWPGQDGGLLGRSADPWLLQCDPNAPRFQVPGLNLPSDLPPLRLDGRRTLLDQVNRHLDRGQRHGIPAGFDTWNQQAWDLLAAPQARRAFDLDAEPAAVRERYGRTKFGQSVLLARRLIEAGVSLVRVNWSRVPGALNNGHWDTHAKNTAALRQLMPIMDQAYSALLEDLAARGLLDETLVVWMAEFGRTPKINGAAGRDHWGNVFSVALAGGGIRGGYVHGASDRIAGYPKDGRVSPADLTATLFDRLGISPESEIIDPQGRPLAITRGQVIRQIV